MMIARPGWGLTIVMCATLSAHLSAPLGAQQAELDKTLLLAAQRGDLGAVKSALDQGAAVDATEYGGTALIHAADRGNLELVRLLVARGADVNKKDLRLGKSPLGIAIRPIGVISDSSIRREIVKLLLDSGADGREMLPNLISGGYLDFAQAVVKHGDVDPSHLNRALEAAVAGNHRELTTLLTQAGATAPGPLDVPGSSERLNALAGRYRSESGAEITLARDEDALRLSAFGRRATLLLVLDLTTLRSPDLAVHARVRMARDTAPVITLVQAGATEVFTRVGP